MAVGVTGPLAATILGVSVALQIAAAVVALRLIRLTGRRAAWVLIATAVALMAVRRFITLVRILQSGGSHSVDLSAELIALIISTLMLVGVAVIGPVFRSIRTSEEAAKESGRRFREIFEENPTAILEQDLSALKNRLDGLASEGDVEALLENQPALLPELVDSIRFLGANRAAVALFGGNGSTPALDDVAGKMGAQIPKDAVKKLILSLARGEDACECEIEFVNLRAERRNVILCWSVPGMHRASLQRVLLTLSDVTERHEMQAQLMVADRLASIGTLAAGVAHEINNPLTYVMGNLGLLQRTSLDERANTYAKEAMQGSERVRDIVSDLQIFSRREPGKLEPINVKPALDLAVRMAESHIRHRARLVVEIGDSVWVCGSAARLTQITLNLLINSAHAISKGSVDDNEIYLRTEVDGDVVSISVRDTGCGIPKEVLPSIFDPFFTTKEPGSGTGLGLYICRKMVTDMGGELHLQASSASGTEFRISLPRCEEVRHGDADKLDDLGGKRAMRILVIDDERAIRDLVPRLLTEHEVVSAGSGREGIEKIGAEHFDLILCDITMGDLNGMDVYEHVRAEHPEMLDRIVLMTGGVFTDEARDFLANTPNRTLSKPFSATVLAELVARARADRSP